MQKLNYVREEDGSFRADTEFGPYLIRETGLAEKPYEWKAFDSPTVVSSWRKTKFWDSAVSSSDWHFGREQKRKAAKQENAS